MARDRNLSDLTPVLAEYILWHTVEYLQNSRNLADWPFYRSQPREQAIDLIRDRIELIHAG